MKQLAKEIIRSRLFFELRNETISIDLASNIFGVEKNTLFDLVKRKDLKFDRLDSKVWLPPCTIRKLVKARIGVSGNGTSV